MICEYGNFFKLNFCTLLFFWKIGNKITFAEFSPK